MTTAVDDDAAAAPPSERPWTTQPWVRVAGVVVYVVGLAVWVGALGIPKQTAAAIGWIWLATVAWDVRRPWRHHLAFVRDWWLVLFLLTVYLYSRGISDDLPFVAVHETEPIAVDRWLFGGDLPTVYLQAHLCGTPCRGSMPPRWYDTVFTTTYYSHFFVALLLAAVLWLRDRGRWLYFMRRYLSLAGLALVCYVVYPMAPPWMAARDGLISDDVERITGRGWFDLTRSGRGFQDSFSAVGNQVAAMPSLHAGLALLVALYGVVSLRTRWRWLLVLYPALMAFSLVYFAEHYVVDVLAGWVAVGIVLGGWRLWDRAAARRTAAAP